MKLRKGSIFLHARYLDLNSRQPARCKVTSIRHGMVYWTYADSLYNRGMLKFDADKTENHVSEIIQY